MRFFMKCPKAKLCGGCPLISVPYKQQAQKKQKQVEELVKKSGLKITVNPVVMAKEPFGYRNKVIVGFAKDREKKVYSGLYAPKSHRVINTSGCAMQPAIVNRIIDAITRMVGSMKIQIYNPKTGTGLLRHVLIRYGKETDQVMVVFVTAEKNFPSRKNLVNALRTEFPQITTILQNINPRDTSIVLQDETLLLYGKGMIEDQLGPIKIAFSPSAFYQINHDQCLVLYEMAKQSLGLTKTEAVLDTYCGVGSIGLFMADACKRVVGVEINKDAIVNARYNAQLNHIDNIRFVAEDSTKFMVDAAKRDNYYDVIILDPPRAGTTPAFIESACALKPKKILYISCDPTTQIRDLLIFRKHGYVTHQLSLVDMFPNTEHIESLCVLEYDPNVKKQQWIKPAKEFTNRPTSSKNKKIKFDSAKSVKKSGRPMKYKKNHH
ncbi:23S rRNA (uracil(1939)-C(5))-methyltransferase RlmD [Ileibacterium valens]|uniref:23S rRNA (uracil(1939)-C(5))-methyltransferase RlmD n=1 Tax=Ileibacterium valens TaxID=1862668 RepID=UPI00272DB443|nr:23S rRNA (uracil(1939)-C(5))-methyltransferase RlmD [Ileibacterium valens]